MVGRPWVNWAPMRCSFVRVPVPRGGIMNEHPNAALYRRVMDGMGEGDMSALEAALADDVVWWQIGSPEPVRGKDAVLESMKGMEGLDFGVDLHDVAANDDHLVGLGTANDR